MASGCRIRKTTNTILVPGVQTPIAFNAEIYDDANYHDATLPTRIVFSVAGRYHIFAAVAFNYHQYAFADVFVKLNNAIAICRDKREIDPGNNCLTLSTIWQFAAGDYIELITWANVAANVFTVTNYSPEFGVELIP
jgi:hypothetical protein